MAQTRYRHESPEESQKLHLRTLRGTRDRSRSGADHAKVWVRQSICVRHIGRTPVSSTHRATARDAVAIHVALGKEQWIASYCHHCAEDIKIHLRDQRLVAQGSHSQPLIYLALPASKWWENIVLTCSNNMVFFSSKDHLAEWMRTGSFTGGEALTVDQTLRLSVPIYKEKMRLDYARPSREQTIAHFQSLGLTGDFWKI